MGDEITSDAKKTFLRQDIAWSIIVAFFFVVQYGFMLQLDIDSLLFQSHEFSIGSIVAFSAASAFFYILFSSMTVFLSIFPPFSSNMDTDEIFITVRTCSYVSFGFALLGYLVGCVL